MKAKEFIIELKKELKPRNFVAKNASLAGKAGQHKDKKKAEKQGDVKHKKEIATMESVLNEISQGNYREKALKQKAQSQMGAMFNNDPEKKAKDLATFYKRERGLNRLKARDEVTRKTTADKQMADNIAKLPELKAEYERMKAEYKSLGGSNWQYADREQNLTDRERQARSMEGPMNNLWRTISAAEKAQKSQGVAEDNTTKKLRGATPAPAPNPYLKDILIRHIDEVRHFVQTGYIDSTRPLFQELYEYFANEIPESVRRNPIRLERRIGDMIAPYAKFYADQKLMNGQGVAEGSLEEFASGGSGGNGPFDYGSAIVQIGQDYTETFNDDGDGADAARIIRVGKTFMSKGMSAGIKAFYAMDSFVRDHVAEELSDQGFNVKQDIYAPYQQQMAKAKADTDKYRSSPEYTASRTDDLKISAIPEKPINSWSKPGEPAASVSMDNASKRDVKAEFEKFKQDVAQRNSLKGVPLKFVVTVGGKPVDIDKLSEQGVAK
jgi:hypothetical protein